MNKAQVIQALIDQIANQNNWYLGLIGAGLALIGIFVAYTSFQQKKISDEQVKKFNDAVKQAQQVSKDLQIANKSMLEYVLTSMSREGYLASIVDWQQKANFYITTKEMVLKYYENDQFIAEKMVHAKRAVLLASENSFRNLLLLEQSGTLQTNLSEENSKLLKEAYQVHDMTLEMPVREYYCYDKDKLANIGHTFKNTNLQQQWFKELEEFNNFWDNETLYK